MASARTYRPSVTSWCAAAGTRTHTAAKLATPAAMVAAWQARTGDHRQASAATSGAASRMTNVAVTGSAPQPGQLGGGQRLRPAVVHPDQHAEHDRRDQQVEEEGDLQDQRHV